MTKLLPILTLCFLLGCSSREAVVSTSRASNDVLLGVPSRSSMSMGVVPTVIAKTINKEQWEHLVNKAGIGHGSMSDSFYYMGTKKRYHYFMYSPALGIRDIYRIHEEEHAVEKPLPLTMDRKFWKNQRGHVWAGTNILSNDFQGYNRGYVPGALGIQNGPFLLGPEYFQIDGDGLGLGGNVMTVPANVLLDYDF